METYGRLHLLIRMSRCAARHHKTRDPADFAAHNSGHIRHRWVRELSTVHAHDVEVDRLIDSTNLLARDVMSALPGTHETNPERRKIVGIAANE